MRQGLFGQPIFDPPLDRQFGWMGALSALAGLLLGLGCLAAALSGWPVGRLWLYLLGSALLLLVGLQLMISWVLMRILEGLSHREANVSSDLTGRLAECSSTLPDTPRPEGPTVPAGGQSLSGEPR